MDSFPNPLRGHRFARWIVPGGLLFLPWFPGLADSQTSLPPPAGVPELALQVGHGSGVTAVDRKSVV